MSACNCAYRTQSCGSYFVFTIQVPGLGEAAAAAVELDLSPSCGGSSGGSTSSFCVQAHLQLTSDTKIHGWRLGCPSYDSKSPFSQITCRHKTANREAPTQATRRFPPCRHCLTLGSSNPNPSPAPAKTLHAAKSLNHTPGKILLGDRML